MSPCGAKAFSLALVALALCGCHRGSRSIPANLMVAAGNDQFGTAGAPLPGPCTVQLLDQNGHPIAGQPVTWTITAGGGQVSPAATTTDAAGQASTAWTLGADFGAQSLQATSGALTVSCQATAQSAPATLAEIAGGGQSAAPGSALPVAPMVTVLGTNNRPVAGVTVTFTVTAGGGTIQQASAQTDTAGQASCGTWTLGAARELNILSAAVAGLPPAIFHARAVNTSPDIVVTIYAPFEGAWVDRQVFVKAGVYSAHDLASVQVTGDGATASLALDEYRFWSGTLSLAGRPRGIFGLMVTATDVLGHSSDAMIQVTLVPSPLLAIDSPLDGAVARPKVDISFSCSDDEPQGCSSVSAELVQFGPKVPLASGTSSIHTQVDLSAYEGSTVNVILTGVGSLGQFTTVTRQVFVESSAHLAVRATAGGKVLDVSGTRVLFLDTRGDVPALTVNDSAAGTTAVLETSAALLRPEATAALTPSGALWTDGSSPDLSLFRVHEWRNGTATALGDTKSGSFVVAGSYALFSATKTLVGDPDVLAVRDLSKATNAEVTGTAGSGLNDVAANGDIAYWTEGANNSSLAYNVHRVRGGVDLQLTHDPMGTVSNLYPVTDGVNVVYRKSTPCCNGRPHRIAFHDGTQEVVLTPSTTNPPLPGSSYAAAGGYVAYVSENPSGSFQIWRHSPAGEQQLTFFASSSSPNLEAMAPDGRVLLAGPDGRYLAAPGQPLEKVTADKLGTVVYRDGKFFVLLGNDVLEVVP